ncbi:MAG: hypothetical protein MJ156_01710 [Alphaproteobacteria bacterium]|nr:hypothetical protein [Alphaproteobacteria bacterium]
MSIWKKIKNSYKASREMQDAQRAYNNSCYKITKSVSIIEWAAAVAKEVAFMQGLLNFCNEENIEKNKQQVEQQVEHYFNYAGNYCKAPSCFYKYSGIPSKGTPDKCVNILFNNGIIYEKVCGDCPCFQDRINYEICKTKLELAKKKQNQARIELINSLFYRTK